MEKPKEQNTEPAEIELTKQLDGTLTFPVEPPPYKSAEEFRKEFQRALRRGLAKQNA